MKAAMAAPAPKGLRRLLHEHIRTYEEERPVVNMHASDLTKEDPLFCGREAVMKHRLNIQRKPKVIITSLGVTFDWGRLTEDRVRVWFADMGRAVGDWKCAHEPCGKWFNWCKRPVQCPVCKGRSFKYVERRAIGSTGVSCGLDLFVDLEQNKLRLIEVKSIDKEKFADLAGPLAEHKQRTQLYLRCIAESADPVLQRVDTDRADVLYVSKGGYGVLCNEVAGWSDFYDGKFSPFKSYSVTRDDAAVEHIVQSGADTKAGFNGGPIPKKLKQCGGTGAPRAQVCPVMTHCFAMKDVPVDVAA